MTRLAPKERRYAKLAAQGFTNVQIAEQCQVKLSTIVSTLKTAFEKKGVSTRLELARLDMQGLL